MRIKHSASQRTFGTMCVHHVSFENVWNKSGKHAQTHTHTVYLSKFSVYPQMREDISKSWLDFEEFFAHFANHVWKQNTINKSGSLCTFYYLVFTVLQCFSKSVDQICFDPRISILRTDSTTISV